MFKTFCRGSCFGNKNNIECTNMGELKGYVSQVIGPVVDVRFEGEQDQPTTLPRIHDAMALSRPDGKRLIVEVQ